MFEKQRKGYLVVAYERFDGEEVPRFEFLYHRGCLLSSGNYERKLFRELSHALQDASDECDGVTVVAYEACDEAEDYEDGSYAVFALEQIKGRGVTYWNGDEIAESIQLW